MSYNTPEDLKYTAEHEWGRLEGETLTIGITDFAQSALGDIVFVELPEVGATLDKNATFGVVESIKSVSDLYSPISGEVLEINDSLPEGPEALNSDPYGSWMIKIKISDDSQIQELLSASDYVKHCEENS